MKNILYTLLLLLVAMHSSWGQVTGPTVAAPSNLLTFQDGIGRTKLTWHDNSNNETGFTVYRKVDGGSYTAIGGVNANIKTYTDATAGYTTNTYKVRAFIGTNISVTATSNFSNEATFTSPFPKDPSGLTAAPTSPSAISLSWADNSNNERSFRIERSTDGSNFSQIAEVAANSNSYNNTGLSANKKYYYRVRAADVDADTGSWLSNFSNTAEATTASNTPNAPSELTATAISSSQINLGWKDNAATKVGFEIERSNDGVNFTKIADVGFNVNTYNNTGLIANTKYYYRVRVPGVSPSGYSNTAEATTHQNPPSTPKSLTATAISSSQINLGWEDTANNESGFEVERSTDNVNFAKIGDANENAKTFDNAGLLPSTKYYYRIRASNSAGQSSYTNTAEATTMATPVTAPNAPNELTATTISSSQINLKWKDTSDNEDGFQLERSTDGTNFTKIADPAANATTNENTGLTSITKYYYRIRSWNKGGQSAYSNTAEATTMAPPVTLPSTPKSLTATAISSSQINLGWEDTANNESGFEIERSTDNVNFAKIADANENAKTYENTGLLPSSKYYYRIRATNSAGQSSYANTAEATTMAAPVNAPNAPNELTATAISATQINLKWKDTSDNEDGFQLERSTDGTNFTKIADPAANATTSENTGLTASTKYYYRIRSWNKGGQSGYSNLAEATTMAPPVTKPSTPKNLTATAISSSQINLGWEDTSNNESGFEIERSTDNVNFAKIADANENARTFENTGLTASTKYYYRVRATNSAGQSGYTNTAEATTMAAPVTAPNAPTELTATAISATQINLKWKDTSDNEDGFQLERSMDGTNFTKIADPAANATTNENTGLTASTKYYYRILSWNKGGQSGYSNVAEATTMAVVEQFNAPDNLAAIITGNNVVLNWRNNSPEASGFVIERSANNRPYEKLGEVASSVTTFSDINLRIETSYLYRLKAISPGGKESGYSNVVAVIIVISSANTMTEELVLFPNPVVDMLLIKGLISGKKLIQIFDTKGVSVYQSSRKVDHNPLTIDMRLLREGAYIIKIKDEESIQILRFIKN